MYKYKLDTKNIEISNADENGHYEILIDKRVVGFIYVSDTDVDLGSPIWNGSTPFLNLNAPEIGEYIEDCDL